MADLNSETVQNARMKVIRAFDAETFYYYSSYPLAYSNFIDGMAWVGLLCGAALKVGDTIVSDLCVKYLRRLLEVGTNARTFAPLPVEDDWIQSDFIEGFWYKQKAQSFAGPAGLTFAIQCGAPLQCPYDVKSQAKMMTYAGFPFGILVKYISGLEQHINSMWLAHLILNKKPASTMKWMIEENPFYGYIAGKKISVTYPNESRYLNGETVRRDFIVPLEWRKPNTWIFRNYPYDEFVDTSGTHERCATQYTPIWMLTAEYLQSTL